MQIQGTTSVPELSAELLLGLGTLGHDGFCDSFKKTDFHLKQYLIGCGQLLYSNTRFLATDWLLTARNKTPEGIAGAHHPGATQG